MKLQIGRLGEICDFPIQKFSGGSGSSVQTPEGVYFYRDNGARILAVAHLDSVLPPTPIRYHNGLVWHPCLDDRLGVYLLLDILPDLGIRYDLLLTEGEERGRSTAMYFRARKKYKWMFSFDRAGTDVVMYNYENSHCAKLLQRHKFKLGLGSFSDIAFLEHLGCKGFNFGVGYYNNHSKNAFANLNHTCLMIHRFLPFYHAYKDLFLKHDIWATIPT